MTYVTTSEVAALKHEVWDHTVELGAGVAEAFLAGAEGTEVLGGLWHDIVVEVEVDAAPVLCGWPSASRSMWSVGPDGAYRSDRSGLMQGNKEISLSCHVLDSNGQ